MRAVFRERRGETKSLQCIQLDTKQVLLATCLDNQQVSCKDTEIHDAGLRAIQFFFCLNLDFFSKST